VSAKKILSLACALGVTLLGTVVVLRGTSSEKSTALGKREQALTALGTCLAKLRPECKVLVLSNPFLKNCGYLDEKSQYERAALRGLRKGLGRQIPVSVVFPEIRSEYFTDRQAIIPAADCRTPLSFVIQPDSVDRLAEAHPECQVIVSLIGLPAGAEQLKIWNDKDPRCFALLLPDMRVLGPPAKVLECFQSGKLLAAVSEDCQSGDSLVITRDNVQSVLQNQPQALGY
jgi:hypothetical protein